MDESVGFVGRDAELGKALDALRRGNNLLVKGKAGIGKSAFLRQLYERMAEDRLCLWAGDRNAKALLLDLIEQTHDRVGLAVPERLLAPRIKARARREGRVQWEWVVKPLERATTKDLAAILVDSLRDRGALVLIESLEVAPTLAELFADLTETCQVAAAMDAKNRRGPLTQAQARTIAERWLDESSIRFHSARVRAAFLRHVAQDSGGVPAAIEGMLTAAANDGEVTPAKVRAYAHEAGVTYLDMTPVVILGAVVFMALRYISRGISETELLVLSGVGSALFYGLSFLMRRLAR